MCVLFVYFVYACGVVGMRRDIGSVRQLVSQPVVDKWSLLSLISSLSLSSLSVLKGTLQKCARRERSWSVVGQGDSKRDIDSMYVLKCININSRRYSFYEFQVSWSKFQEVNTYLGTVRYLKLFGTFTVQ